MRTELWNRDEKTGSQYSLVVILEILSIQLACLLRQTTSFFPTLGGVTGSGTRSRASGRGAGEKNQFFYVVHSISSYCHPRVQGMKVVSEAVTPRETTRMNVLWIRTCKNRRLHPSGDVTAFQKRIDGWIYPAPPSLSLALSSTHGPSFHDELHRLC